MAFGIKRLQKLATSTAKKAKEAGLASKKKPDLTSKEYKAQQVAKRNAARKAERAEALKVKKGKAIAKKKAIAKNVAAKKVRDAAGMARAKKLASQGQATAKKRAKAGKPASPEEILQRKLMIERGVYKPKRKAPKAAAPKKTPKKKGPFSDAVMKRAAAKQKQIWSYYSDEPIPKDVLKDMAKPKAKKSGVKVKTLKKKKAVDNRNKRNDILRRILNATDQDVINRLVKQLKKLT